MLAVAIPPIVGAILKAQTAAGSVGIIGGADLGTQKAEKIASATVSC